MYPCEIKEQPARHTLSIRFRSPVQDLPKHFGRVYGAILEYLGALGEPHTGAAFAAYYNLDMQNLDIEAGFPVSKPLAGKGEIRSGEIPGGMVAICHYTGPYDGVGPACEELTEFIQERGYAISGVCYEWYLNGPDVPPQELKTDIIFPVTAVGEKAEA
jgi:effector-binding domain-containing protein